MVALLSQASTTVNLGFEKGSFAGWKGYTWRDYGLVDNNGTTDYSGETKTTVVQDIIYTKGGDTTGNTTVNANDYHRRQVIISDTTAYDVNTGNALKEVPSGYKYSARLGCPIENNTDAMPRGWEQSLRYKMKVDATNSLLIMKFACVLQYASDHTSAMEPRFELTLYDQNGNTINTCSNYDVYTSSSMVTGWNSYTSTSYADPIKWRNWTSVGANLSSYIGDSITIEFLAADCKGQYHFGYAYFVADSQPMTISTNFCGSSDTATLTAPTGFESYKWREVSNNEIVNTDTTLTTISVPMENEDSVIYHCILRSATGCVDSLSTTILKYKPTASFSSTMTGNCSADSVQFTNKSTTNRGTLSYLWDYGDGTTDSISSKVHLHHYTTSGHHTVTLTVYNPPSTCSVDTVKDVESIDVDLVGLKADKDSICIGSATGELIANGAWMYKWSMDSTATTYDTISIKTGLLAGKYWVIGYNSTYGCWSQKQYASIYDESNWQDSIMGNRFFCKGASTQPYASGWYVNTAGTTGNAKDSLTYKWSTGATSDTITVNKAGNYTLTATDRWGCSRTTTATVVEEPLPSVDFSVEPTTINTKRNYVECSIPQEANVTYLWNMGDGSSNTCTDFLHYYTTASATGKFTIALTDSNTVTGCTNAASTSIIMEPFVPNVFTPNGDGHNDYFMPNYEMQVFDRNGMLLYSGTINSKGWDGTYNGEKMDPDTYFYILHYTDYKGQTQTKKGYITLIR